MGKHFAKSVVNTKARAANASRSNLRLAAAALAALGGLLGAASNTHAADGTWDDQGADNNWQTLTNWSVETNFPGTTSGFASTESATFSNVGSGTINLGNLINIRGLNFATGANAFTIGDANDTLNLSNNGTIYSAAGVTSAEAVGVGGTVLNLSSTNGSAALFMTDASGTLTIAADVRTNQAASQFTRLTLDGAGTGVISGVISNAGLSGASGLRVNKTGAGTWSFTNTNTYSGTTTITNGQLNLSTFTGSIAASPITLLRNGTLGIDSSGGTPVASVTRAASITSAGGTILVTGSAAGNTNDLITGALTMSNSRDGRGTLTVAPNAASAAVFTIGSITRASGDQNTVGGGFIFVNGTNLGSTASTNAARVIIGTAPSFAGSTTDGGTAPGTTKTLGIVNYMVGEIDANTGNGTATGTPNTFLTYNATTGLRPLNLADEFTNNAIATGTNTRITANTNSGANVALNSLLISGGNLNITAGGTTISGGAVLMTTNNSVTGAGQLVLGTSNRVITVNENLTAGISAPLAVNSGGNLTFNVASGATLALTGGLSSIATTAQNGQAVLIGGGTMTFGGSATYHAANSGFGNTFHLAGGTLLGIVSSATVTTSDGFNIGGGTMVDYASISGSTIRSLAGSGTLKLAGANMTLTATSDQSWSVYVTGGRGMSFNANAQSGVDSIFTISGNSDYAGGTSVGGTGTVAAGAGVLSDTGSVSVGSTATLQIGGNETIGSLNATAGTADINNLSTTARTLTINTSVTGDGAYAGVLRASTNPIRLALVKRGSGTQTLSGLSTYTGSTTVQDGTLRLDLATNNSGVLGLSALVLSGGHLDVVGATGLGTSQTLADLTLDGGGKITVNRNGGSGHTLTLGNNWTRNGASTLNVDLSSGGVLASTPTLSNGVLGYATVTDGTGTGLATVSGANVVRLAPGTALTASSDDATVNFSASGNVVLAGTGQSVNSLSVDVSSGDGALDLGAGTLAVASGGVVVSGTKNYTIQNGQLGASGAEVILHQYSSGLLSVSGSIGGGAGSLVVDGTGEVLLSGNNTYAGGTFFNGGITRFSSLNNLGSGDLSFNGGTLQYTAGNTVDITSRTVSSTGAGAVIDTNGNNVTLANAIGGNGGLTKTGAGVLTLAGLNTFSGDMTLEQGSVVLDLSTNTTGVVSGTTAVRGEGGTLVIRGKSTGASSQLLGGFGARGGHTNIVLNSNGGSGTTVTLNNTWARAAGATANVDLSSGNAVLQSQHVGNSNNIVGGWITVTDATTTGFATYASTLGELVNPVQRYTGATNYTSGATGTNSAVNYSTSSASLNLTAVRTTNSFALDSSSNTIAISGSALAMTSGGLLMVGGNDVTFTNSQVGGTDAELIVNQYGTGTLTINKVSNGAAGRVTKTGPGTLNLTGVQTFGGQALVNSGVLGVTGAGDINSSSGIQINGGSAVYRHDSSVALIAPVTFGSGGGTFLYNEATGYTGPAIVAGRNAVVGGTGTVAGIDVSGGGTIAPGVTIGHLTTTGNVTLGKGHFVVSLDKALAGSQPVDADYDRLNATGVAAAVNLTGGNLVLSLGGGIELGDEFFILTTANGTTGPFASVNGVAGDLSGATNFTTSGIEFDITYTADFGGGGFASLGGNDVALKVVAVPEPVSLSMLALAGAGLLARRRRKS